MASSRYRDRNNGQSALEWPFKGGGGLHPLTSTRASQTASFARVTANRVLVTSVQLHTRDSNENVLPFFSGTTSCHGTANRTKSYTDSPPGLEESSQPCRSSHKTRIALAMGKRKRQSRVLLYWAMYGQTVTS